MGATACASLCGKHPRQILVLDVAAHMPPGPPFGRRAKQVRGLPAAKLTPSKARVSCPFCSLTCIVPAPKAQVSAGNLNAQNHHEKLCGTTVSDNCDTTGVVWNSTVSRHLTSTPADITSRRDRKIAAFKSGSGRETAPGVRASHQRIRDCTRRGRRGIAIFQRAQHKIIFDLTSGVGDLFF